MVYVKNVIREMFQQTYVIRDLNENRLVIRDRDPPFTTLLEWMKCKALYSSCVMRNVAYLVVPSTICSCETE